MNAMANSGRQFFVTSFLVPQSLKPTIIPFFSLRNFFNGNYIHIYMNHSTIQKEVAHRHIATH